VAGEEATKMVEFSEKAYQVIHVLDQSAAKHRDEGEDAKSEADKKLAESFAEAGRKIGAICARIERRIQRNEERAEQGLPPLTLEEQDRLDELDGTSD
jgi:hypothetical protein